MEKLLSLPKGVALRGPVYHLQIKVPLRLRQHFPGPFWIRMSLGTADKTAAAVLAHKHWAEASEAFARAEAKMRPAVSVPLTPAIADYVVREAMRVPLAHDDAMRFSSGGVLWLLQTFAPPIRFLHAPGDPPGGGQVPAYLQASEDGSVTHAQLERLRELHEALVSRHATDLSLGRLEAAMESAEASCASLGIVVDWSIPENRPTLIAVARALLEAWIAVADRDAGKPVGTPAVSEPPGTAEAIARVAAIPKPKTLDDAFAVWKVGKKADAISKTARALAMVKASKQAMPLKKLTRQHALDFRDYLNEQMPQAAAKTRSDLLASVQALLNFAVKEKGWIEVNPWAGTAIAKGRAQRRDAWANDEIAQLLAAPLFQSYALDDDAKAGRDAQYWLPLLALLTGARQAELWQLRVTDVIQRDGVWLLDINEDTEDKSVKSAAGIREVAVHPKLIELGFIDYLTNTRDAGHVLLFPFGRVVPSRTASVNYSDFFREQCQALGLYRRFRDFHAFRTTVGTTLRASEPPLGEALITAVMGHEAGNVGAANYHRPAPRTLERAVVRLDFPAVVALPRMYPKGTPSATVQNARTCDRMKP